MEREGRGVASLGLALELYVTADSPRCKNIKLPAPPCRNKELVCEFRSRFFLWA
jgi:hypothetical protein